MQGQRGPHSELGRYVGTVLQRARLLAAGCNSTVSLLMAANSGPPSDPATHCLNQLEETVRCLSLWTVASQCSFLGRDSLAPPSEGILTGCPGQQTAQVGGHQASLTICVR